MINEFSTSAKRRPSSRFTNGILKNLSIFLWHVTTTTASISSNCWITYHCPARKPHKLHVNHVHLNLRMFSSSLLITAITETLNITDASIHQKYVNTQLQCNCSTSVLLGVSWVQVSVVWPVRSIAVISIISKLKLHIPIWTYRMIYFCYNHLFWSMNVLFLFFNETKYKFYIFFM